MAKTLFGGEAMSKDKEVWVYVDGKPLCRVEAWEAEKDSDEEEGEKE